MRSIKKYALDDQYRRYLVSKSEEVQREYDEIVASGDVVSKHNFILPETIQGFAAADGKTYGDHLYADERGLARIRHESSWEERLIAEEEEGADFVCWLRNPPRQKWSLCVPYTLDGEHHAMYPDFLVVRRDWSASSAFWYVVDILEPHNPKLTDNLAKAQGLARYAKEERAFGRIQLVREFRSMGGASKLRRLDLNKGAVRDKVLAAINDGELTHIFDTDGFEADA